MFDGLMPHVAGGGLGFFNHRFAQPTRHNGQHEEHLYPGRHLSVHLRRQPRSVLETDRRHPARARATENAASRCRRSCTRRAPPSTGTAAARWSTPTRSATRTRTFPESVRDLRFRRHAARPGRPTRPAAASADNLLNPGDYRPLLRAPARRPRRLGARPTPPRRRASIRASTRAHWSAGGSPKPAFPRCRACAIRR